MEEGEGGDAPDPGPRGRVVGSRSVSSSREAIRDLFLALLSKQKHVVRAAWFIASTNY